MSEIYNALLARLESDGAGWEDAGRDYRMLLLRSSGPPTFDATHATVRDVLQHANNTEPTDGSYSRQVIPVADRTLTPDGRALQFHIDEAVDFGALTGETIGAALVYEHQVDDELPDDESIPIAFLTSSDFPLASNGAGFTVNDGADGLFEVEAVSGD